MLNKLKSTSLPEALAALAFLYLLISVFYSAGYISLVDLSLLRMLDYKDFLLNGGIPLAILVGSIVFGVISSLDDMKFVEKSLGKDGKIIEESHHDKNMRFLNYTFFPSWPFIVFKYFLNTRFSFISILIFYLYTFSIIYYLGFYNGDVGRDLRIVINTIAFIVVIFHMYMFAELWVKTKRNYIVVLAIYALIISFVVGKAQFIQKFWGASNALIEYGDGSINRAIIFGNYSEYLLIRVSGQIRMAPSESIKRIDFDILQRGLLLDKPVYSQKDN